MEDRINELIEIVKSLSSRIDSLERKVNIKDGEIDRLNKICRNIKTI